MAGSTGTIPERASSPDKRATAFGDWARLGGGCSRRRQDIVRKFRRPGSTHGRVRWISPRCRVSRSIKFHCCWTLRGIHLTTWLPFMCEPHRRQIHQATVAAALERHHLAQRCRLSFLGRQFNGRRRAIGEGVTSWDNYGLQPLLVVAVKQHLADVADVECLAAEGAGLEMVAGASPVEIPFPPSPYHRQRTIPAFHGSTGGLPPWASASAGISRPSARSIALAAA